MELFDIGLDGEEIEASPDFDDLPAEPPKKKIHRQKSTTKKERDYLIRKIQGLSLDELASFCLDKTWTKLIQHPNAKHRDIRWEIAICWLCACCWLHYCRGIIIVRIARIPAAGCYASHVIFWLFAQTSFLGVKSIKLIPRTLIDTVDTFRRSPLTHQVLVRLR